MSALHTEVAQNPSDYYQANKVHPLILLSGRRTLGAAHPSEQQGQRHFTAQGSTTGRETRKKAGALLTPLPTSLSATTLLYTATNSAPQVELKAVFPTQWHLALRLAPAQCREMPYRGQKPMGPSIGPGGTWLLSPSLAASPC